ncbi:MAG TPA: helix-turn-helix domain-containing protein [Plantibacter sp.]|uniref:helix-turn-helix domain-containing protein n=1 Tax=unclassified Plantibacter TaxID=2624265 RepID=UPI002CF46FA6|nr:helix-turn-helix domain-containing protein [Plantibacter sp.]
MHNDANVTPALRRGVDLCLADLEAITGLYVRQVRTLTGYVESVVAEQDIHSTARRTLHLMFRQLRGERIDDELREHSGDIGRKRARQGVPLESLLRAVRMDFRFIWQALEERLPDETDRLSDDVVVIWEVVEAHTTSVQAGYMLELGRVRAELEQERAFLLRRLLHGSEDDRHLHLQAGKALEIPERGPYWVVVSHPDSAPQFATSVLAKFPTAVCLRLDGVEFAIIAAAEHVHPALADQQLGISQSAATLSSLGAMWLLARELAELATPGRAATVASFWPVLAARQLGPIATGFAEDALAALRLLPSVEQALLIEAVTVYAASGSASVAAAELFCHRNTVMNRLARFAQLTALDITVPDDAATVKLLLAVQRAN